MGRTKKVRLQDIAETTGFSISTVSHFINKTRNIDESTQTAIMEAIQALGYQMPSKRKQFSKALLLGVIVSDIRIDFFDELIKELEGLAYEEGFQVIVMDSEENPEKEKLCLATMMDLKVSGLLIAPSSTHSDFSSCSQFPIVQIDRMVDTATYDFVGIDNMMTSYDLTKSLLEKGRSNIGLVTFSQDNFCARERTKGYRLAMLESNRFHDDHILLIEPDADSNPSKIRSFLLENPHIDTLLCTNSNICYEVLGKMQALGASNPIRYLTTFDNNKWLDHVSFPVDAVTQPITDIAVASIQLLKSKIRNPQSTQGSKKIILTCAIEGRSSLFRE
ncbi:LacI family DNA-binding transcriptional regulator [Sphaerochaeta sp. PS]|uniref:LacI family DNA-binding transcriptional regulator n=1 Tax=Sphaerochaeta sp. PS TaxID=3076336 RepID=UPI0028A4DAFC|nr:LacI family DNA-binding transcriptional regulator [Sphaerochaeta sp. PS]MDT4763318.1 LacI family DNA-binding transcriptional regulator [Sphaerochaeta sp. PS]